MNKETLDLLAHELGEIYHWEEECPGVYYLSILTTIEEGGEYYAVLEGAPITQEARAIGLGSGGWCLDGGGVRDPAISNGTRPPYARGQIPARGRAVWGGAAPGLFWGIPCTIPYTLGTYPPPPSAG